MIDLEALILGLVRESKAERYKKKQEELKKILVEPTEKQIRFDRLLDKRWKDERIVLFVTESRCECGANYEHPHPHLFVRRWHPALGLHFESLGVRPITTSKPYAIERHVVSIRYCHRCLTERDVKAIESQMLLPLEMESVA